MGQRAAAVWATTGLLVGAVLVVVVVSANQDRGGPPVNDADPPLDAVTYAVRVQNTCSDGLAAAERAGYEDSSQAGAVAMHDLATDLAALPPPAEAQDMAQALVDGVADYADLFRARDGDDEAFSQRQNELVVVLEARARGLGSHCATGDGEDWEAAVHDPTPADVAPEDEALRAAADDCFGGDLAACDDLADSDSGLVFYGVTCGGRLYHEEADNRYSCVETFAGERPTGDQP